MDHVARGKLYLGSYWKLTATPSDTGSSRRVNSCPSGDGASAVETARGDRNQGVLGVEYLQRHQSLPPPHPGSLGECCGAALSQRLRGERVREDRARLVERKRGSGVMHGRV